MKNKWRNDSRKFCELLNSLKEGKIKIPLFQRNFVWNYEEIICLLNSINDGHPIGSFIFWETNEKIVSINKIVNAISNNNVGNVGDVSYVIDGQQRFTTLVTLFYLEFLLNKEDIDIINDIKKFKKIVYNCETGKFEKLSREKDFLDTKHFRLEEMFNHENADDYNLDEWVDDKFRIKGISIDSNKKTKSNLKNAVRTFYCLDIAILWLNKSYTLEEVVNLFEKINTKGKKLSVFEIVNAKWFVYGIKLEKSFSELEDEFGYEKEIILDSLFLVISDKPIISFNDKINFDLGNRDTNDKFNIVSEFKKTVAASSKYLEKLSFNSRTIPSKNIFKWISYLFFRNNNDDFCANVYTYVQKYIALLCINNSYESSTNSQLEKDIKFCDAIINKNDVEINKILNEFEKQDFDSDCFMEISSETNMLAKLMISILLNNNDFFTGVKIDENNFDIHHIYPKKGYKDKKYEAVRKSIHSFANITPIRPKTNKKILNKKFSEYIEDLLKDNKRVKEELQRHFINCEDFKKDDDPEIIESNLRSRNTYLINELRSRFLKT